jgi:hypothetical protein
MCGIVSVFGSDMQSHHGEIMHDLLVLDQLRGMHATGVMKIGGTGIATVMKGAGNASNWLLDVTNKAFVKNVASSRGLIGHNRYATMGNTSDPAGAHPFQHGNITMVHNGTLDSRHGLSTSEDHPHFLVDSDQVAFTLSETDTASTVRTLDGAFVLAWHNETDNSLNFVRNTERPFFIAKLKNVDVYVCASEQWMIHVACSRRKVAVEIETLEELTPGTHMKYVLGTGSFVNKTAEPVATELTLMPESEKYYGNWNNYNYNNYQPRNTFNRQAHTRTVDSKHGKRVKQELEHIGFEMAQEVAIYLTYFRPYVMHSTYTPQNTYGVAIGVIDRLAGPTQDVVVHSMTEAEFKMGEYTGKVASICHSINDAYGVPMKDCITIGQYSLTKSWEDADDTDIITGPQDDDDGEDDIPTLYGPKGIHHNLITKKEFTALTKHGCGYCTTDIGPNDDEDITWEDDTPICSSCSRKDDMDLLPAPASHPEELYRSTTTGTKVDQQRVLTLVEDGYV